ncbi:hypothetical protein Jiend_31650 [Micromonospora endophytica]|nr:hypothetical protein Jiend_31650 [Micromonospora endophytica]
MARPDHPTHREFSVTSCAHTVFHYVFVNGKKFMACTHCGAMWEV